MSEADDRHDRIMAIIGATMSHQMGYLLDALKPAEKSALSRELVSAAGLDPNDVPRLRAELAAAREALKLIAEYEEPMWRWSDGGRGLMPTKQPTAEAKIARAALGDAA